MWKNKKNDKNVNHVTAAYCLVVFHVLHFYQLLIL